MPRLKRGIALHLDQYFLSMKRSEVYFSVLRVPADLLALFGAALAAYHVRFAPIFTRLRPIQFDLAFDTYIQLAIPAVVVWMIVFALVGLYRVRLPRIAEEIRTILFASGTSMAVIFAVLFFSLHAFESRFIVLAGWGLGVVFVIVTRLILRSIERSLFFLDIGVRHAVLIGTGDNRKILEHVFSTRRRYGVRIIKSFSEFSPATETAIRSLARAGSLDDLILTDASASRETMSHMKMFTDTEHLTLRYSADLFAVGSLRVDTTTIGGIPLMTVKQTPLDEWGAIYKRGFDIVASILLITITAPIMFIAALAILLDSRGPIFFSRLDDGKPLTRIGESGKPFRYFKFRSMFPRVHNQRYGELAALDTRQGPLVKIKNDPRVTRVGRFLRMFSIDELPELFLVLAGRMSLVGPRPHLPEEVAVYATHHRKVHTIKPGITGLAQISGRADLDFEDEVRLDTFYIENWSPWLDLVILLKTPFVVLFRKGAY